MTYEEMAAEKAADITVAFINNVHGTVYALKDADAVNEFFSKVFQNVLKNMADEG